MREEEVKNVMLEKGRSWLRYKAGERRGNNEKLNMDKMKGGIQYGVVKGGIREIRYLIRAKKQERGDKKKRR